MSMMKTLSLLPKVILCLALLLGQPVLATGSITLAFWQEPATDFRWRWGELVYREAFRRLGIEFHYKVVPPARASAMADSGEVDGEPSRIAAYAALHPDLIRVNEVVYTDQILAYAVKPGMVLNGWEDFRGTDYRVEHYRGMAYAQEYLPGVVKPEHLSTITTAQQGLKQLIADRIDVYVDSYSNVSLLLASPEFKDAGIYSAGVLMDISSYPYLHKRHADWVPKLAEVLRQMKAEGLVQQYFAQAKQEVTKQ